MTAVLVGGPGIPSTHLSTVVHFPDCLSTNLGDCQEEVLCICHIHVIWD